MSRIALTVNGEIVVAEVAPRTHLADFLREDLLLTGTHLGCEHGVCGACTVLIDGVPARSCIAFAVTCDGAEVRTVEGLEDDPIIVRLRAAFSAEHALQCGYCTPGMLVVARDIVQRLPEADEGRIRLELAGNLCRCTGYAGIVRAIRCVLADGVPTYSAVVAPLPTLPPMGVPHVSAGMQTRPGTELGQTLRLNLPLKAVWSALHDPFLIAECIPGARVIAVTGDQLRGQIDAALGPIETSFVGHGTLGFDDEQWQAEISGEGRDTRTGTRLDGRVTVHLREAAGMITETTITLNYSLRGTLAHFARGSIAREFVAAIVAIFATNLEARLSGAKTPLRRRRLSTATLIMRVIWQRFRVMLGFS